MAELRPGDVFVNHRIEGLAGRGGMGVVYRATDLDLDRTVALKVIAPALAEEPDFRARFVAESKAAASIEHPHVIPVYYAGELEGVLFIVMRYVDGPDLRALVRARGPLEPERAAQIVAQVGGALDAAHAHGLVHRDVKPANVLLGAEDHAYLTDFGLTKREASTGGLSRPGGWVGTLGFVAPEQIRGERVDARTDVYALGCVLVHALTGGAPYVRETDEATLWAHLHAPPPTDSVPPEFAGVVERALSKDPGDRYPSAGDLGRAALAAAGRSAAPGPERLVARGAAAPDGAAQTSPTRRASLPAHEGETQASPREWPGGDAGAGHDGGGAGAGARAEPGNGGRGAGRRRLVPALGAIVLLAGVLAALAITGGDDPQTAATSTTSTTSTTAETKATHVGRTRGIATKPNSITITRGRVWAMSTRDGAIVVVDAKTAEPVRRITIRTGGTAVAADARSVWAVKGLTGSLLRIDAKTGQRTGPPTQIIAPGQPVTVAPRAGKVWVGVRKSNRRDGTGESVVRVDPSLNPPAQEALPVDGGVQDLAVGEGGVWVTTTFGRDVVRIDPSSLKVTKRIPVGAGLNGIATGAGAVWVVSGADKTIVRISPRSNKITKRLRLGVVPTRVAVGGGSVWATARDANRLFRIDPRRVKLRETLDTGSEPFALDVGDGAVWLTLVDDGGGGVQRVRFYR